MRQMLAGFVALLTAATLARADYVMWLEADGSASARVNPGESLTIEVWLGSDAGDQHDAAIWRVAFSAPGLRYDGYDWAQPYEAGSIFDDSKPFLDDLPVLLDEDTLSGGGYEQGLVDVELSNVTMSGAFGEGRLASLILTVPTGYSGPDQIVVHAMPDSFAMGFDEISTHASGQFTITVPAPGGCFVVATLGLAWLRRNRA